MAHIGTKQPDVPFLRDERWLLRRRQPLLLLIGVDISREEER